jgi:hypothetical protein
VLEKHVWKKFFKKKMEISFSIFGFPGGLSQKYFFLFVCVSCVNTHTLSINVYVVFCVIRKGRNAHVVFCVLLYKLEKELNKKTT